MDSKIFTVMYMYEKIFWYNFSPVFSYSRCSSLQKSLRRMPGVKKIYPLKFQWIFETIT